MSAEFYVECSYGSRLVCAGIKCQNFFVLEFHTETYQYIILVERHKNKLTNIIRAGKNKVRQKITQRSVAGVDAKTKEKKGTANEGNPYAMTHRRTEGGQSMDTEEWKLHIDRRQ
jgi:hypothetical protein